MASAAGSRKPSMQPDADGTRRSDNGRASWEDEALDCEGKLELKWGAVTLINDSFSSQTVYACNSLWYARRTYS